MKLRAWLGSYFEHPSRLVHWSAILYLFHVLLQVKIALGMLTAWASIFLMAWALARKEVHFSTHILYFPLFLYGLASTMSALAAKRHIHGDAEGTLWFKMLIFPCAVMLYREMPRLRELMANYAYVLFGGGMAVWGLLEFVFLGYRDLDKRMNGPASHVMTFSGLLLPVGLMYLLMWMHERKRWQLALSVLIHIALLLTFTRSVWLGWTVAVLVILAITRSRLRYYAYILPALLIFLTLMPLSLFSRLLSTFDPSQSSNFDRIRMIEAGVEMIKDNPVLGVGPANVKEYYAFYKKHDAPRPRPPHLHNNVVQIWAERGILGLTAYLLLLALFLRECARAWDGPNRMWAEIGVAVTVSLTVAGLFEFNFGDTEVLYLMLNLFALVATAIERTEPVPNEQPARLVPAAV
jgi:O-antigen ligase